MARRSIFREIFPPFVAVTLCSLLLATWYASSAMRRFYVDSTRAELAAEAILIARDLPPLTTKGSAIDALCQELGAQLEARVTVILPSGKVVGDSDEEPGRMDNHADREEVRAALAGTVSSAVRRSPTLRETLLYVAAPVLRDGSPAGVVRVSRPVKMVTAALREVWVRVLAGSTVVGFVAVLLSLYIARRLVLPLRRMREGALLFAQGGLDSRLVPPASAELAELARAMNYMADQLQTRLQTISRHRNELDTILAGMVEGVLAVDREDRVLRLNRAAAALFGIDAEWAHGRNIQEVIRNPRLQRCVQRALHAGAVVEEEVVAVHRGGEPGGALGPGERYLHVRPTVLKDDAGQVLGALLVLGDITELRRLEAARTEFVANVSHEIRTPLTAIKAAAETLLEGALEDPVSGRRFLEVIVAQADRLDALVGDILALSSLERPETARDLELADAPLDAVAEAAAATCARAARAKDIQVRIDCPPGLRGRIHSALLEHALANLLDNAIKYSPPGAEVQVEIRETASELAVAVRDSGPGIAPEHLPRLFERFYRVDKARSRKEGGTGLGLSIVKHIARVHGGRVDVESTPGKGSCFYIYLPRTPSTAP